MLLLSFWLLVNKRFPVEPTVTFMEEIESLFWLDPTIKCFFLVSVVGDVVGGAGTVILLLFAKVVVLLLFPFEGGVIVLGFSVKVGGEVDSPLISVGLLFEGVV